MIIIKTPEEIKIMAENGKILAKIMKEIEKEVKPGISTKKLDIIARKLILKYNAKPCFLGYHNKENIKPFPAALCASLNQVIVHGVPNNEILKDGDILSLDLGIFKKGFCADMAITVPVGRADLETLRLIRVTKKALKRGIKKIQPGNTLGDVGNAIQKYIENQGLSVVRDLCGHGIGKEIHEDPQVLNYGKKGTGFKIVPGMVFCLEPMVVTGDWKIKRDKQGYGWETKDGNLSAHFEHTIAVTNNGCKILTKT